jgi:hypothetical protein
MNTMAGGLKKLVINLPRFGRGNWWVEITTELPNCVYYFGPFIDSQEAHCMCPDYVQDLMVEGAQKIQAVIKRCYPAELTKCDQD